MSKLVDAAFAATAGVLLWLGVATVAGLQNDGVRAEREVAQAKALSELVAANPGDADEIQRVASCIAGQKKCSQRELDSQADRVLDAFGRANEQVPQPWPLRWIANEHDHQALPGRVNRPEF